MYASLLIFFVACGLFIYWLKRMRDLLTKEWESMESLLDEDLADMSKWRMVLRIFFGSSVFSEL